MKIAVFNTKPYDEQFLAEANRKHGHELVFFKHHLDATSAAMAEGFPAVCVFVNDDLSEEVVRMLALGGTKVIALRCAGFNNVDLKAAQSLGLTVVRVPAYSPYAVAEHTLALILTLNRKTHRAFNRVREGNFSLDGLLGFDLHGKTAGIVGTGKIGEITLDLLKGFGCKVLAYDPHPSETVKAKGVGYVSTDELFQTSDIISLHCPLTPETRHLIDEKAVSKMKPGVMLINTSRGAIIDTPAVIEGLKSGQIGYLGIDVYEEEGDLFFEDLSCQVIQDDVFARLLSFPNVLVTGHQAFFTEEALHNIGETTLANIADIEAGRPCPNEVKPDNPSPACQAR